MTLHHLDTTWLTAESEPLSSLSLAVLWASQLIFWMALLITPAALALGHFHLAAGAVGAVLASCWVWMNYKS